MKRVSFLFLLFNVIFLSQMLYAQPVEGPRLPAQLEAKVERMESLIFAQQAQIEKLKNGHQTQADQIYELEKLLKQAQSYAAQVTTKDAAAGAVGSAEAVQVTGKQAFSRPQLVEGLLSKFGVQIPHREMAQETNRDALKRTTPSGAYADPSSFFFLHGYTSVNYSDFQQDLSTEPGQTGQILVAGASSRTGKHSSGFKTDSALFIGSEISENLSTVMELHLVGNARDPVITEAKFTWEPFETPEDMPSARVVAGRYWWPFGNHNDEWFSAVNKFNLQSPAATEVVPAHLNEVGVMVEGEWAIAEDFGMNYLLSIGNGASSFELSDNVGSTNSFDIDNTRFLTTRIGLFPWIENLETGVSFAAGKMRTGLDFRIAATDARHFDSDLIALGFDMAYSWKDLDFKGYWYFSEEDLGRADIDTIDRNGGTFEILYNAFEDLWIFKDIDLKARFSHAQDATILNGTFERQQYGFGLNVRPHEYFLIKSEYFVQDENGIDESQNNGFNVSGTVEF